MTAEQPDVQAAVAAAVEDLTERSGLAAEQISLARADLRLTLRAGERVWHYVVRADGIPRLIDSGEADGGHWMAPPPRMDI